MHSHYDVPLYFELPADRQPCPENVADAELDLALAIRRGAARLAAGNSMRRVRTQPKPPDPAIDQVAVIGAVADLLDEARRAGVDDLEGVLTGALATHRRRWRVAQQSANGARPVARLHDGDRIDVEVQPRGPMRVRLDPAGAWRRQVASAVADHVQPLTTDRLVATVEGRAIRVRDDAGRLAPCVAAGGDTATIAAGGSAKNMPSDDRRTADLARLRQLLLADA